MKAHLLSSVLLSAGLLAGCSKSDNKAPEPAPAPKVAAPAAATEQSPGVRTIALQAGDAMKFDLTTVEVAPGQSLKVVMTNSGTLPKDAMAHNWILLKAGSDPAAFATAAQTSKDTGYIPVALKDEILAQIQLLGPKETGEVSFKAPTTPGEYPYPCSFPAHFLVGMKGVLIVK